VTSRMHVPAALSRQWGRVPAALRLPVAVYASVQTVYLLWWAAFFPGLMSYDSITYTWEVTTNHWIDDHSILYDSLLWLSLQTTGDVWLLTLLQTVAMSAVLAYTCVALRDLGVRGRWSALAALCVAVLPSTGSLTEYVWKDAAFAISALLAFAAVARLVARRLKGREAVRDRGFYIQLGLLELGFIGIALFRNSSVDAVIAAAPLLLIGLRSMRRWITALVAGTTALYLALNFLVYPAVGITMPTVDNYYAMNYADIAVAYGEYPSSFTKADKAVMEKVAPLKSWGGRAANCWDVDWTMAELNRPEAAKINDQLMKIWFQVLKRSPQIVAQAHLCRSQIAWGIFPGPGALQANTQIAWPAIAPELFGQAAPGGRMEHSKYRAVLHTRPLSDTLHKIGYWVYLLSMAPQTQWLLWRGAFWCYTTYGVAIAIARRRRKDGWPLISLAAMTFGLQLAVIAANPAALARYMLPSMVIGFMTVPLISLLRKPAAPLPPVPWETLPQTAPAAGSEAGPAPAAGLERSTPEPVRPV
jgi:hypothetical protein